MFGEIKEDDSPLDVADYLKSIDYFYHNTYYSSDNDIKIGHLEIKQIHGLYQSNKLYGVVMKGVLNTESSLYDKISIDTISSPTSLDTVQEKGYHKEKCKLQTVTNHFINKYGKPHYLLISEELYISYWHFNKKDILIYGKDYSSNYTSECFIAIYNPQKFQQFVASKERIEQELLESQLNELKRQEQQRISDSIQISKEEEEELAKQRLKDSQKSKAIKSL